MSEHLLGSSLSRHWDPEFLKLRSGLDFYEFSASPELAAQASLLPKRFGVDGIILFFDITTLAVAMGMEAPHLLS